MDQILRIAQVILPILAAVGLGMLHVEMNLDGEKQ